MKALVGAFNQEKALVGAFSVIVKTDCESDRALHSTNQHSAVYGRGDNHGESSGRQEALLATGCQFTQTQDRPQHDVSEVPTLKINFV